ncbi:ferredoxin [Spinactinospora alkalitolerans]|uniref:Ferredoxin n=1 Tax=Spinactinospora alkalitolerans TaxID=687207 RepID=A0A852TZJ8_9ACTN|nr:ferredoxin [Spinactinospora alkalitolerans]NYE48193.1 ferredoxin [Spinactinospora alkalitolerans]
MFISVDAAACMGHGRCYSVAADLLSDDEQGFVAQSGQTLRIPGDLLDQAREAADACPEGAISIVEEHPDR